LKPQRIPIKTPNKSDKSPETSAQTTPAKKESQTGDSGQSLPLKSPARKQLPNGLIVEDVSLGNGQTVSPGRKIEVKYIGRLSSNGKVFDSSLNKPFSFRHGVGEVIKGWDAGIKGMRVGGKRKLIIPPQLGYGTKGKGPIPPNATLEFEVELVKA